MFKRILIANRGEIAVRVFRACRELEIEPVVVYSQADREALHVQLAEQAYCIGPARSADSYLNVNAILTVAQAAGCDAIHPGYGFLSENADFADACEAAGITFIGPSGDVIRAMGNKAAARKLMQSAGVPVVPGSDGAVDTAEQARALADSIGYPVLIKASAGGGGRGMRRVYEPEQLIPLFEEARSESLACFGSGEMYLEKLIVNPRHIEFQIMADGQGHVIQLGDRDCSIQRRNQKLLEESPSKALTPELRELIERTREISRHYEGCQVNICLNYGGRDEILRAARDFARDCAQGKTDPGGGPVPRPRHRVPHQRRGPGQGVPALSRPHRLPPPARRLRRAGGHRPLYRLRAAPLLRLPDGQADRLRPHPAGGHPPDAPGPGGAGH